MSGGKGRSADPAETASRAVPDVDHRLVFERVSAACAVLLPDAPRFSVVAVSDAYLQLTLASRVDAVGVALLDTAQRRPYLVGESQFETLRGAIERAIRTRTPTRLLLEGAPQESAPGGNRPERVAVLGRPRWAILNTPILDADGEVRYVLHRVEPGGLSPHESGERERTRGLELMLEERTRDLESALGELDAFSYSVSHDLRAPLRAIDGFVQALSHDYASVLDGRAQQYIDRVRAGAQRMSALIDDMLELARLQRSPLRRARVDLTLLAQRVGADLVHQEPARQVAIEIAPDLIVDADPHLMGVLLEKLIDNAWKFTGKKSEARIVVGRDPNDPQVFFVSDDGVGFDMAHSSRLFSPFQRLHKQSDFDGNGIGLAVAQRVVARHGGRIWAEAKPGQGATFRFCVSARPS